jgi:hypothetical protein
MVYGAGVKSRTFAIRIVVPSPLTTRANLVFADELESFARKRRLLFWESLLEMKPAMLPAASSFASWVVPPLLQIAVLRVDNSLLWLKN